jgi:uncharacterized protein (TIGR02246 family)
MVTGTKVAEAIQTGNRAFMSAIKRQDAAGAAALYTPGGQLVPPHSDFVKGAEGIRAFWQSVMDSGVREAVIQSVEIDECGDTAIELGTYTLRLDGGRVADSGKYLVVWKEHGGAWRIQVDIWNTSRAGG